MAETAATKGDQKPRRSVAEVQRDLDAAMAKYNELHPKVEADTRRGNAHNERINQKTQEWKKLHPGEEFDEIDAGFDATPYAFNEDIQREFHAVHYTIAQLKSERDAAIADRVKA